MTPYLRKDSRIWRVTLTDRNGKVHRLSSGTRDKYTAEGMDLMLSLLGRRGMRGWEFFDAVIDGRLPLAELYDYYLEDNLGVLRDKMRDVEGRG